MSTTPPVVPSDFPAKAKLAVEVSGVCNMRCPMCAYPRLRRAKGFMNLPLWKKIVDDAAANGHQIEWIHNYGEPLLWPHLIEGIRYLKSKGLWTQISTNGLLLTREMAERLAAVGQKQVLVALDSLDPAAYAKLRVGGDLELVKRNIHETLDHVPTLRIQVQFMPSKHNVAETTEEFYREFGRGPNFKVIPWSVVRMTDEAEDITRDLSHAAAEVDKRLCDKLFERVMVLWDGRTVMCCLDVEGELITGDLNANSIAHSFLGSPAMELCRRILRGEWDRLPACDRCLADHVVLHWAQRLDQPPPDAWRMTVPPRPLPAAEAELLRKIEALAGRRFDEAMGQWVAPDPGAPA